MHLHRITRLFPGILLCVAVFGQSTGSIQLQVNDSSGAAVAVTGRIEALGAGAARTFETNPQGTAVIDSLAFGRYRLDINKPGFAGQEILVEINSTAPVTQAV